ncbi:MAG TPA: alpha-amylase family glycosyl hydrolase [Thermoflexales bacterium]|nr:alpha-amylase family glycosyl hydrolase [Thermoflexales bacterium]
MRSPLYVLLASAMLLSACAVQPTPSPQPLTATLVPSASPLPPTATPSPSPQPSTPTPLPPSPTPRPSPTPDPRPVIKAPAWFNDVVGYQIFPRSFQDSDGNGIGDLKGIEQKLDYIQALGVGVIWLTPFYPSASYHGYDVGDYFSVNPQLGTLDDFKSLAKAAHARGIKLIVDYVANHSGDTHPYFKDAYKNPKSKYSTWYQFNSDNSSYSSFFGVRDLPNWNHDNPEVDDYLIKAGLFWLEAGADGLRCDYALGVREPFWQKLRAAIKAKNPDALLLGEVWDTPFKLRDYFGYGFDALFDFPFYLSLAGDNAVNNDAILGGKLPGMGLNSALKVAQRLYPRGAQLVRFASNHDTNRIASETSGDPQRERLAAAAALLLPGTPFIYYGEEIGMRGTKGPGPIYDEYRREPMDWFASEAGRGMTTWFKLANRNNKPDDGISVEEQDADPASLLNYYRALVQLRSRTPALRGNDFLVLEKDDFGPCGEACFGLWRWSGSDVVLALFNFSLQAQTATVDLAAAPVPLAGAPTTLLGAGGSVDRIELAAAGVTVLRWRGP